MSCPYHAAVREIAAAEAHLEMFVFRHTAPDRADDGRDIPWPGVRGRAGNSYPRLRPQRASGRGSLSGASGCRPGFLASVGVDERIAEQIVQTAQVVADHHRQRSPYKVLLN